MRVRISNKLNCNIREAEQNAKILIFMFMGMGFFERGETTSAPLAVNREKLNLAYITSLRNFRTLSLAKKVYTAIGVNLLREMLSDNYPWSVEAREYGYKGRYPASEVVVKVL